MRVQASTTSAVSGELPRHAVGRQRVERADAHELDRSSAASASAATDGAAAERIEEARPDRRQMGNIATIPPINDAPRSRTRNDAARSPGSHRSADRRIDDVVHGRGSTELARDSVPTHLRTASSTAATGGGAAGRDSGRRRPPRVRRRRIARRSRRTSKPERLRRLTFVSCGPSSRNNSATSTPATPSKRLTTSSVSVGFGAGLGQVVRRRGAVDQPAAELGLRVGQDAALQLQPGQRVLLVERGKDRRRLRAGMDQPGRGREGAAP